jgi:hypothetical protein
MIASRELSIFVPDPEDPENAIDMTLSDYLEFKQKKQQQKDERRN